MAARELEVEQVAILEHTRDGRGMLARAGRGLPTGSSAACCRWTRRQLAGDLGSASSLSTPRSAISGRSRRTAARPTTSPPRTPTSSRRSASVLGAAAERSAHDELVRDSEAQFRELADTTPALMWMTDAEGDVTFVNKAWLRFTGGSSDVGETFAADRPPRRPRAAGAALGGGVRQARAVPLGVPAPPRGIRRLPLGARGGHAAFLRAASSWATSGPPPTSTSAAAMEDALRESEAGFRELADTAPAMIWTTDADGLVTFVNAGWLRFTGTTLEEELGASWTLGVHPDDADVVLATWETALAARRAWEREYRLQPSRRRVPLDRRPRRAALRGRPLRRLRGHGHRHPRAQDDGGALCSRSTSASTRSRRRSSAACCPSGCRRSRASSWRRATCPAPAAPRSAATGTTRSSGPTAAWRSWWATWSATGCAPRPPWASSATPSAPTAWSRPRPPRSWRASTGW